MNLYVSAAPFQPLTRLSRVCNRYGINNIIKINDISVFVTGAFETAYALFEIPSGYLVRAPLIWQWDYRAQPGVIELLLERGEENGEPELARAV